MTKLELGQPDKNTYINSKADSTLAMAAAASSEKTDGFRPPASRSKKRQGAFLKSGLTEDQRRLFEFLILPDVQTIKEAARRAGISEDSAYQIMLRTKMNASKADGYMKEFGYYRAKLLKQGKGRFLNP